MNAPFIHGCPVCQADESRVGAKMADIRASSGDLHGWQVICDTCGTAGPVRKKLGQAIADWNQIRTGGGFGPEGA